MNSLNATTAPLTTVLRQVALDIASAQKALDEFAQAQAQAQAQVQAQVPAVSGGLDPDLVDADLVAPIAPPIAFFFPEVELDLSLAFSVTRFEGRNTLAVAPANPVSNGFFQSASFSSRLRAKIAPRALVQSLSDSPAPLPISPLPNAPSAIPKPPSPNP